MEYKDENPIKTIVKLDKFFRCHCKIDLDIIRTNKNNTFPSFTLFSKDIAFSTNGKGKNTYLALASAYGEFYERISNFCLNRFSNKTLSEKNFGNKVFYTENNIKLIIDKFIRLEKNKNSSNALIIKLLENIIDLDPNTNDKGIPCIKFESRYDDVTIPIALLDYFLGTNGMSAGNTYQEALVQAYSEVIERHTIKMFNKGEYIPKILESDQLINYPEAEKFLSDLSMKYPNYKSKLYIFEQEDKFPVSLLFIYDKEKCRYCFKFGCHFNIEKSIERSFSEIFQGNELENSSMWINLINTLGSEEGNSYKIFIDGRGELSGKALINLLLYGNKKCTHKDKLLSNLDAKNYIENSADTYIFKCEEYLSSMCSIQIYCPQKSRVKDFNEDEISDYINAIKNTKQLLKNDDLSESICNSKIKELNLKDIAIFSCPADLEFKKNIPYSLYLIINDILKNNMEKAKNLITNSSINSKMLNSLLVYATYYNEEEKMDFLCNKFGLFNKDEIKNFININNPFNYCNYCNKIGEKCIIKQREMIMERLYEEN